MINELLRMHHQPAGRVKTSERVRDIRALVQLRQRLSEMEEELELLQTMYDEGCSETQRVSLGYHISSMFSSIRRMNAQLDSFPQESIAALPMCRALF
jgi:hypothetical protein